MAAVYEARQNRRNADQGILDGDDFGVPLVAAKALAEEKKGDWNTANDTRAEK